MDQVENFPEQGYIEDMEAEEGNYNMIRMASEGEEIET